jgi:hypothetical protein
MSERKKYDYLIVGQGYLDLCLPMKLQRGIKNV